MNRFRMLYDISGLSGSEKNIWKMFFFLVREKSGSFLVDLLKISREKMYFLQR